MRFYLHLLYFVAKCRCVAGGMKAIYILLYSVAYLPVGWVKMCVHGYQQSGGGVERNI